MGFKLKLNGQLLRNARKGLGEELQDVATAVGRAPGTIKNIESGTASHVSQELAEALAAHFGLNLDDIVLPAEPATPQSVPPPAMLAPDRISYTCASAALATGIKPRTIQAACREGRLKAAWIGDGWVFLRSELVAWIERETQETQERKSA